MLRLRDILQFPSFYSKRNLSVNKNIISITKVNKEENSIEITGSSGKYNPKIQLLGGTDLNNIVNIFCDCESFKFEFSSSVFKNGSLLNPDKFGKFLNTAPRKKNAYMIPSGCKHIISLAKLFIQQKNKYI